MLNSKKCTKRAEYKYVKIIYNIGEYTVKTSCKDAESCVKSKISEFVHIIEINGDFVKFLEWSNCTKMALRIVHCNKKFSTHWLKSVRLLTLRKI